ncbi:MAG: phosphoribosyltransferase family protein [Candidatus Saccharimonadales bacterium]
MYFASRTEAGKVLAKQLQHYRFEDCVVLALSDGGVVIGAQITARLHCPLMFLLTKNIVLPGERTELGTIDQSGGFTYNDLFSTGELEGLTSEYHGLLDQLKMEKQHELNRLLGDGGLVDAEMLQNRNVILVSDGLLSGISLVAAMNFLKPVQTKKIVIAAPFATVAAVDKMHVLGDELQVLRVVEDTFAIDHYYEKSDVPEQEAIIRILNEAILKWK